MTVLIPDLEFRCPDCPLCFGETNCEDGYFYCEDCGLIWSPDGSGGEKMDAAIAQCEAERSPYVNSMQELIRGHRYRCQLGDGHRLPHRGVRIDSPDRIYDIHTWSDKDRELTA